MANRWYVVLDGDELGPLSDTGLERLIQGGRVDHETMVRNDASGEWMSAAIAEELLAARPSRERPGDAAIQAARQAKQSIQRPPAPPATISLSPQSPPPLPPASAPAASAAPSTHASTKNESPVSLAPEPVASPAPGRSPLVWVGVAAGAVVVLTVSFAAGWFALHRSTPPSAVAPPPSAAPGVSPEVAALQQQAEQLKRELEEAQRKLENALPTPAASQPNPPPAPDVPRPEPVSPDPTLPNLKRASAPSSSAAPPKAAGAPAPSEPMPTDLLGARKSLAELIAKEQAMEEELEARKTYLKKFKKKPEVEFKSSFRTTFDKHLPEAEAEAAKLEGQSLVLRRREIEGHFETRKQEAAQWLAETKSAIAEGRIESAIEAARKYALAGAPEEMDAAIKLLRELDQAQPMLVYAKLSTLSASKLQQIIADERLPADWPQPSEDAAMAEAIRKSAVRLAPLNLGVLQKAPLADQFLEAQNAVELTKLRKFLFLFEAEGLRDERRLTPKNVQSLVDQFGAFRVDDLTPLIDIALAKDSREMGEETAEAYINSVAAGDIRPMSLRQLYDDCRKAAGDSWPVDDERHSLAGRWQSKGVWQLHIDPEHESIAWLRSSPQAKFEQRICKIGRDHVVAYELRTRDQRMPANHPFAKEKLEDRGSYEQLFNGLERLVMLTSFKLDKRGETLKVRREAIAAAQFREAATTGLWNRMSNDKASREWPEEFQRIEPEDQQ